MEELKIIKKHCEKRMEELEKKHKTDICSFINGDDPMKFRGDWSENEVLEWEAISERLTIINQAIKIIEQEKMIGCLS